MSTATLPEPSTAANVHRPALHDDPEFLEERIQSAAMIVRGEPDHEKIVAALRRLVNFARPVA